MEYKIKEKESFKIIGLKKNINYETVPVDIPKIWTTFFETYSFCNVKPKYVINYDELWEIAHFT